MLFEAMIPFKPTRPSWMDCEPSESTLSYMGQLTPTSSSPCSRLNHDSLCEIIYWCAEILHPRGLSSVYNPGDEEYMEVRGELGWIVLTHVCQHWREVVIGLPALWGRILPIFPTAFDVVHERARGAPIAVAYVESSSTAAPRDAAMLRLIREHPERLSSLTIHAHSDLLSGLCDKEYPFLQSFVLQQLPPFRFGMLPPFRFEMFDKNPPLVAPVLTELSMFGYLTPVVAPNLVSLHIRVEPDSRATVTHVLECLQQFPMLESLSLDDAFHMTDTVITENNAHMGLVVRLDRLKKANITAHSLVFSALWKHLSIPVTTGLYVSLFNLFRYSHELPPIQPAASVFRDLLLTYDSLRIMRSAGRWATPGIAFSSSKSASSLTIASPNGLPHSLGDFRDLYDAITPHPLQKTKYASSKCKIGLSLPTPTSFTE
jgi:hypothetical protein